MEKDPNLMAVKSTFDLFLEKINEDGNIRNWAIFGDVNKGDETKFKKLPIFVKYLFRLMRAMKKNKAGRYCVPSDILTSKVLGYNILRIIVNP